MGFTITGGGGPGWVGVIFFLFVITVAIMLVSWLVTAAREARADVLEHEADDATDEDHSSR